MIINLNEFWDILEKSIVLELILYVSIKYLCSKESETEAK